MKLRIMLNESKLPNPIRGYAGKFVGVVPFQTRYDLTLRMTEQFLQVQLLCEDAT